MKNEKKLFDGTMNSKIVGLLCSLFILFYGGVIAEAVGTTSPIIRGESRIIRTDNNAGASLTKGVGARMLITLNNDSSIIAKNSEVSIQFPSQGPNSISNMAYGGTSIVDRNQFKNKEAVFQIGDLQQTTIRSNNYLVFNFVMPEIESQQGITITISGDNFLPVTIQDFLVNDNVVKNNQLSKGVVTTGLFDAFNGNGGRTIQETSGAGTPYTRYTLSGSNTNISTFSSEYYRLDFKNDFEGIISLNMTGGDGLAFVMQNDSRGTKAISTGSGGGTLGVYGSDNGNSSNMFSKNIKNSVAIEMDTATNPNLDYLNHLLNIPLSTPHIAYTYPDRNSTTFSKEQQHNSWQYPASYLGETISNNGWMDLHFEFNQTTQLFTYYFTNPGNNYITPKVVIPWEDLSSELNLEATDYLAYWGITAANGSNSQTNSFAIVEMPINLKGILSNDIEDKENHSVAVGRDDDFGSSFVRAGDEVTIKATYHVQGTSPNQQFSSWDTYLDPKLFNLSETGAITDAQLKFEKDGRTIPYDSTSNALTGEVQLSNDNVLLSPGDIFTIEYKVKIKNTILSPIKSSFNSVLTNVHGQGAAGSTSFPSSPVFFWVDKALPKTALLTFESNDGDIVPPQTITIGEKGQEPKQPLRTNYIFDGWYRDISLTVPYDFNTVIENDLTVYAKWRRTITNPENGQSGFTPKEEQTNSEKEQNSTKENLRIQYASDFDFGSHPNTAKELIIYPKGDYGQLGTTNTKGVVSFISIIDDRSTSSEWSLTVSSNKFSTTDEVELEGAQLIFSKMNYSGYDKAPQVNTSDKLLLSTSEQQVSKSGSGLGTGSWSLSFGSLTNEGTTSGVQLYLPKGHAKKLETYTTVIDWTLVVGSP